MKTLSIDANDAEILEALDEWVQLLAEERYQDAYDFLYHESGDILTPELIKTAINNYGYAEPHWSGKTFKVALPVGGGEEELLGNGEVEWEEESPITRYELGSVGKGILGQVLYPLPLEGEEQTDLTAVLDFRQVKGELVFHLETIHVL